MSDTASRSTRNRAVRSQNADLLVRSLPMDRVPPTLADLIVDRAQQLRELTDLADNGLLSPEELDGQRRRILGD